MVGAWCFLDHLGPVDDRAGGGLAVGPHPHIGLQTFTWMIEGEVVHRDSLGNEQVIRPGQVNLMSAGGGISHAEDSPAGRAGGLHGVQLWIALDESRRHGPPAFHHHPRLPVLHHHGCSTTLLVGSLLGETSPVEVFSPLLGADIVLPADGRLELPLDPGFEHAVLVLEGGVAVDGTPATPDAMAWLAPGRDAIELRSSEPARLVLIGGEPFGEDILLWWNFVARTQHELAQAVEDWNHGSRFGEVHGSPSRRLVAPDLAGVQVRPPRS